MPFPPIFDPLFSKERILVSSGLGVSNPETKAKRNAKAAKVSGTHHDDHSVDHNKYKTRLCRNWKETGKCPYGDTCVYAHGAKEMRCREQAFLNGPRHWHFQSFPSSGRGSVFGMGSVKAPSMFRSGKQRDLFCCNSRLCFVFSVGAGFFCDKIPTGQIWTSCS